MDSHVDPVLALLLFRDTSTVEETLAELEACPGFVGDLGVAEAGEREGAGDDLKGSHHQCKDVAGWGVS
eukprot:COSAG04_NODE_3746_length_2561_cov_4.391552_3_plen_69_part_00